MRPTARVLVTVILATAPVLTSAQASPLAACRAIPDSAARLACYDALPLSPEGLRGGAQESGATPSARTPASAEAQFGSSARAAGDELQELRSTVPASFDGWRSNQRIRLDNGQVWQVIDGSSGFVIPKDRQVTLRRGALGSFLMEFAGSNLSVRVRRVE